MNRLNFVTYQAVEAERERLVIGMPDKYNASADQAA
jgi:hypothetical protein